MIITLYRTVSEAEWQDFSIDRQFRTAKNTLEAKQFFKSEDGVKEFIKDARLRKYAPPYKYILHVSIDKDCLESTHYDEQILDRFEALTIHDENLTDFNKCVNFVEPYVI